MRKNLFTGAVLAVAALLVVALSAGLDLDLESVALLGAALGAVIALVPDRTPLVRLLGFGVGFAIAWAGYVARAGLLPDTSQGRGVTVVAVVVVCTLVAALSLDRIPLWPLLLGAAGMAGAYEFTYSNEPTQVLDTSMSVVTTMVLTVGIGFLAASIAAPVAGPSRATRDEPPEPGDPAPSASLDEIMERVR